MARFPRNESDNSLNIDAYFLLSKKEREEAMQDLEDNGTDSEVDNFFKAIDELEAENNKKIAKAIQDKNTLNERYNFLEEEKKVYIAAYQKDLESTLNNTNSTNSSTKSKASKGRVGCTLF